MSLFHFCVWCVPWGEVQFLSKLISNFFSTIYRRIFFFHICIASGSFLEKSVDHRNEWFYLGWLMCSVAKLCPALCYPMDYRLPGSSVHEIFQARVLEWVDISFFRGYSWPRYLPASPTSPGLACKFFTTWASWESPSP